MKNKKRTIGIAVIAVLVIALVAVGITLLKSDRFGYNYFERNQTIASVGNVSITKGEFAQTFNDYYSNIDTYNLYALYYGYGQYFDTTSEDGLSELKAYILESLLQQKAYVQMAEEMGITLTEEEEAECKQDGQDAYDDLFEQCVESAKSAGSTTPETYATTTISTYLSNMGLTKSGFIARQVESSRASLLADKVYAQLQDEKVVTDEELPEIYEDYVQTNYVDSYTDGTYSTYEYYRRQGSYTTPYLYVPEGFVFIRTILITDPETGADVLAQIKEDPTQFETILKNGEINEDEFMVTLDEDEGYGIGENDSLFDDQIYEVAKNLEVGDVQMVSVESTTTDDDGNEVAVPICYIIKRIEGEPAGILAYEKVADEVNDTLLSYVKSNYANDALESWMEKAGITKDQAAIAAVKAVS